jgi:hypothetical protein
MTDAEIERIADAVPVDQIGLHITTWHRRFARAVLAAQPLHEQLREMGEAHAAQPAPVPKPVPVAWLKTMYSGTRQMLEVDHLRKDTSMPVYTHPAAPVPVLLTEAERAMLHDAAHIINRAARTKGDHWDCVGSLLTRLADGGIAASPEKP